MIKYVLIQTDYNHQFVYLVEDNQDDYKEYYAAKGYEIICEYDDLSLANAECSKFLTKKFELRLQSI